MEDFEQTPEFHLLRYLLMSGSASPERTIGATLQKETGSDTCEPTMTA